MGDGPPVPDRRDLGEGRGGGLTRIDPAGGARLAALDCGLVWATTWMDDANSCLAPWLGLPPLPVVDWPFLWVDDEITAVDREWVAAHHPAPALLHRVDHRCGLTAADFAALEEWVRRTRGCGGRAGAAGEGS
ncbi:hypothetical protein [Streptomyces sp. YU58]|uniref:hypothetical protein n=1 Tax=Streptomyces sp. SX92 TaxID=3158972 RepID=UPI0027B98F5F|nr:hypothetical protein [Streptomyces coralus]WLW58547.1 hypothetical protein QU709_22955 [Streptomyces coralus]